MPIVPIINVSIRSPHGCKGRFYYAGKVAKQANSFNPLPSRM